VSKMRL